MTKLKFYHSFQTDNLQKKRNYNIKTKQKASENSEALLLYFCMEIPIFEIIVDVFQEHSAKTSIHHSMVVRM